MKRICGVGVCQRHLGLSEAEDTRLEKYSFLEDRMSLWYCGIVSDPSNCRLSLVEGLMVVVVVAEQ